VSRRYAESFVHRGEWSLPFCLVILFGLDLAIKVPFGKTSWLMDGSFIALPRSRLGYLSWSTFREQV